MTSLSVLQTGAVCNAASAYSSKSLVTVMVVEDGSPQQLIASGGRFAAMYASWDELNQVKEADA